MLTGRQRSNRLAKIRSFELRAARPKRVKSHPTAPRTRRKKPSGASRKLTWFEVYRVLLRAGEKPFPHAADLAPCQSGTVTRCLLCSTRWKRRQWVGDPVELLP